MTSLVVDVLDAFDLMPKDGHGSSNPYVEVSLDGQVHRTLTKFKDLNPSFNQTLVFNLPNPSLLPNLTLDVSLYHDPIPPPSSLLPRRHFLGRVRISGASIPSSPSDSQIQRFPLDKRGLFSNIKGDIALLLYLRNSPPPPQPPDAAPAAPAPPPAMDLPPSPLPHKQDDDDDDDDDKKQKKKQHQKEEFQEPTRNIFYSVPAAAAADQEKKSAAAQTEFRAAPAAAPPPMAMMTQGVRRPAQQQQQNPYGVIETRPPIAGRLGYRTTDKISSTYDLVEQMQFLYVNVVKARDLPAMDITGSLDPYAEVRLGNYKGTTKHLEKNSNPVWGQIFAFSRHDLQANSVEVTVKDKDFVKDDFVGKVSMDITDIPVRVPPDAPLAPLWYRLEDKKGFKLTNGEIMLAVWLGTQADEAFPEAWHSDAHNLGLDGLNQTRSKVYFSPKLCYLRVSVIEAQDLVPNERTRVPEPLVRIQLGHQVRSSRGVSRGINPVWNEEFMFVAGEPFDEPLIVSVEDRMGPNKSELMGRVIFPVGAAYRRTDINKLPDPVWLNLLKPILAEEAAEGESKKKEMKFSSKIQMRIILETGYHVLDESAHYSSDLQPFNPRLRKSRIGILELGILNARNLEAMKAKEGRATDAYCVAKYGSKWVRTRTLLNTLDPRWNEQYTWEVYDPCTVLTIGVFDNCHVLGGNNHDNRDQRIGKVRIRLSTLETNRVYTHFYPLLVLQPSGLKKTGELQLAVRFTCIARVNMVALYGRPLLPKMHYIQPIPVLLLDNLRFQAMHIVALRLSRAEPPLRREVVEYMLDVGSNMWSLRRSKANFFRITSVLSGLMSMARWFDGVRNWRNPITTILVHALFLILVCYPELILPTIFLYLFMIGMWNYRYRPRNPPHMDTKLSCAENVNPDELDEEFDTFPSAKPSNVVRMRYDRMRSVSGRVQTVVGDLATQGERAQALLSWRDPRATAIFIMLSLIWAVVLYVTPFQVIVVIVGLYLLRHPRFRSKLPSVTFNFYRRLPAKSDMLL